MNQIPIWICLGLAAILLLLRACRSVSSTIKIQGEIAPEPIVGEIATLHIEVISQKYSGEGLISVFPGNNIDIIDSDLKWHGHVTTGEPFTHELAFCITRPSTTAFYIVANVTGTNPGETQIHIISDGDSDQVLSRS